MGPAEENQEAFFYVIQDSLKIVFVDDDPILREFAAVHLSSENSEVVTFCDGLDALENIDAANPDIILLDLEMPRMDGFEFLEKLRRIPAYLATPVIVCTGREDVRAIDRAFQAGATSFIVKPLNWRLLTYQIRYVDRACRAEKSLKAAPQSAPPQAGVPVSGSSEGALLNLAWEGSRFLTSALRRYPDLRLEAGSYAQLIETTLKTHAVAQDKVS